jgi:tail collar domain
MSMRTIAALAAAAVLVSGSAAAAAAVTTGTPASVTVSGTIHGCVRPKTGALTILLKSGAKCAKGTTPLSWSTAGPRGPRGLSGTATLFGTKTNAATTSTGGAICTLGSVLLTAGTTASVGTLPADGQLLKISSNTPLFDLLGTRYGGNGTSTFALPNLKKAAPNGLTYSVCATSGIFP